MASPVPAVDRELRRLQQILRQRPKDQGDTLKRTVSTEPQGSTPTPVSLSGPELRQFRDVHHVLLNDPRFEHLDRKAEATVWGFVRDCIRDKTTNHVPGFIAQHGREPLLLVCYAPVEYLSVAAETEIFGIRLLPLGDQRLPTASPGFRLEPPVGCAAAVRVRGTSYGNMADWAKSAANHALRVLRIALREHRGLNDWQLRFRLAGDYALSDGAWGTSRGPDSAFALELGAELVLLAVSQPVAKLPLAPTNDLERKADLSARWLERARFAGEPIVALLYLFFGLEALLGDTSERLKGHRVAFRQAMLSHIATGMFPHPTKTYLLYDEVRSAAVHGEEIPTIATGDVREFDWIVRQTLNEYLAFGRSHGFSQRAQLVDALDTHPDRRSLVDWLRARGGKDWDVYLTRLDQEILSDRAR